MANRKKLPGIEKKAGIFPDLCLFAVGFYGRSQIFATLTLKTFIFEAFDAFDAKLHGYRKILPACFSRELSERSERASGTIGRVLVVLLS